MTKRTRRKLEPSLRAKIAPEALREPATVNDLAKRHQVHPNPIYVWKKPPQEQPARALDAGVGHENEAAREREIERLHVEIGELTVEIPRGRGFLDLVAIMDRASRAVRS